LLEYLFSERKRLCSLSWIKSEWSKSTLSFFCIVLSLV